MLLEYLPDASADCPLIRLYSFSLSEAARLGVAVAGLAVGSVERVAVHELPGVEPVDGCELVLRVRAWDQAVVQVGPASFECGFTSGTWDNVAGLIEPFATEASGYQWLAGGPGEVSLLLSVSGKW